MARDNTVRSYENDSTDQVNTEQGRVTRDFEDTKSLSAKATRFGNESSANNDYFADDEEPRSRTGRMRRRLQRKAQESLEKEHDSLLMRMAEAGYEKEIEFFRQQLLAYQQLGAKGAVKQLAGNILQRIILLEIGPFLLAISIQIWFVQFIFAASSLFFIGSWATLSDFVTNNFLGKAANLALRLFNSRLENLIPLDSLALGFWGIAAIIGFSAFICFMLFFTIVLRIDLLKSAISSIILFFCLALTIMPVGNLIPWLTIWIFFVIRSEVSFFSMALEQHKSSKSAQMQ